MDENDFFNLFIYAGDIIFNIIELSLVHVMYSMEDKLDEIMVLDGNLSLDVRLALLSQIENQDVLLYLANSSSHDLIREYSIKFITDSDVLKEFILKNDLSWLKHTAISNPYLSDLAFLKELMASDNVYTRCAAIENPNINDQSLLIDLAHDDDVLIRKSAVKGISDEEILKDIYLNDENDSVKQEALKNINDNEFIYEVLKGFQGFPSEKMALVDKIDDEEILVDIVLNDWTEGYRHVQIKSAPVRYFPNPYYLKMQAIQKIREESSFIRIAKELDLKGKRSFNDSDLCEFASYAVNHIGNNQETLIDIAYNAKFFNSRRQALKRISDENILLDIAVNDDLKVSEMAVLCIDDEEMLRRVIFECPYTTSDALKRIQSNDVLLKIVKSDCKYFYRSKACAKLSNEDDLKEIFLNDSDLDVRAAAVANRHLADEAFLMDVACNSENPVLRRNAVSNYSFQNDDVLKTIALSDEDIGVCREAAGKIKSKEILEEIVFEFDDEFICRSIVENPNFTNQVLLEKIALSDLDEYARAACVKKIKSKEVLEHIALNDKCYSVRSNAVKNPNFTDENLLVRLAMNDESHHVRWEATDKISDNAVLAEIFYNDDNINVKSVACSRISDEDLLIDIINNESTEYLRCVACMNPNMNDEELLKRIIHNEGGYLPHDACSQIRDEEYLADTLMNSGDENLRFESCINPNLKDKDALAYAKDHDSMSFIRNTASRRLKILNNVKIKVMFVSDADTMRSVMAKEIFKRIQGDKVEVFSSGIMAKNGTRPSQTCIDVCKSHGIDIANHRATYFKDSDIADMDVVLTFDELQKSKIRVYYPQLEIKTFDQFLRVHIVVPNPPGDDFRAYDDYFNQLCDVLKRFNLER